MANLFAYSVTFSLICLSFSSSLIIFIRVILVPLCEGLMDIHLANGYISAIARPYTLPGAVFYVLRKGFSIRIYLVRTPPWIALIVDLVYSALSFKKQCQTNERKLV